MKIDIGYGEWADRLSILLIKSEKIEGEKAAAARKQAMLLGGMVSVAKMLCFFSEFEDLVKVNEELWEVEDELRKEDIKPDDFLHYARRVPLLNDKRHLIKVAIDMKMGTDPEIKSYQ